MGKEQEQGKPAATKTEEGLPHECVLTDEDTHNASVDTALPSRTVMATPCRKTSPQHCNCTDAGPHTARRTWHLVAQFEHMHLTEYHSPQHCRGIQEMLRYRAHQHRHRAGEASALQRHSRQRLKGGLCLNETFLEMQRFSETPS